MRLRYRYRIYPTKGQEGALLKAFGCARWVYNQSVRIRTDAYAAGVILSDTEVQKLAVTAPKRNAETAWLAEVSVSVLQQACRDARKAHWNWINSLTGKRRGGKMGAPRMRRRRGRQSVCFVRSSFRFRGDRLNLTHVGDIKVEWSRPLPSMPTSVRVIREPDGRFYASFVVEVAKPDPLPPSPRSVAVDLGISTFATAVFTDGVMEKYDNPRNYQREERRLSAAAHRVSRKQYGSNNRRKGQRRVAVIHRKIRERRLDHHHKLALHLIRENQAVAVEDLPIAGLKRTKLAKFVSDVAWGKFICLLAEKADRYGRTVIQIGRFEPTTRTCSRCGIRDENRKPLHVREWACQHCGIMHDRDVNAARNILVAAGLAETLNVRGGNVRPDPGQAGPSEAGTHRGGHVVEWRGREGSARSLGVNISTT